MLATALLLLSTAAQLAAVVFALRELRSTRRWGWILFVLALAFMLARRLISLSSNEPDSAPAVAAEAVALVTSVLLLGGVVALATLLRDARADAARVARLASELAAREARQRQLVERLPAAVAVVVDGRLAFANGALGRLLDARVADILGRSLGEVVAVDDTDAFEAWVASVPPGDSFALERCEWQLAKGEERWVATRAARGPWQAGDAVFVTLVDITEVKRAEDVLRRSRDELEGLANQRGQALRQTEEAFRALAESSVDVVMRFDRAHRHLYVSPRVEGQTGIAAADFIGRTHAELGFPEDLVTVWEGAIDHVFSTGEPHRVEFELPSGIWIDWSLTPEAGPDATVHTVVTTARDITDLKHVEAELLHHRGHLEEVIEARTRELRESNESLQREVEERRRVDEALRESEERFRTLYDNATVGLYRSSPDGRILIANPALVRMLGLSSFAELAGRSLAREGFLDLAARRDYLERLETDGEVHGLESRWTRADGEVIHVRESAKLVRDLSGVPLHVEGTVEDVTAHRKLEDQLRQAQKMEALGQLAGGVAHDFNNLLLAMTGSAELLHRRLPVELGASVELGIIERSARRAGELTRGLLAFARRQVLEPNDLDLAEVVKELLPVLRRILPETMTVDLNRGEGACTVRADRTSIDQMVVNLCVNARDAVDGSGTVAITIADVTLGEEFVASRSWARAGHFVMLEVADDGCGMTPDTVRHVFEPFFTTKPPGRGTGMGLASVYGLVKQQDGFIDVESAPGLGAVFRIYLPRTDGPTTVPPPRIESTVAGGSETILVAEDEAEVRHVLVEALRSFGYRVLEAANGQEALALLQAGVNVDLVLTDVVMPEMGGDELWRAAASLSRQPLFLFSSGYAEELVDVDFGGAGAEFIAKPYGIETLARRVREILDRE